MKKDKLLLVLMFLITYFSLNAQVAINTDGSTADPSAMLEVKALDKGMLIPRMTQLQITAIPSPVDGLIVYNTDVSRFYFFDENVGQWIEVAIASGTLPTNCGTITDTSGNTYNTIQIGSQCWMGANLATTKFNDGSDIPLVISNSQWNSLTTPGYCWYNNDESTYGETYGALYNWYSVNAGNLCPSGWHVPTDTEWSTLSTFLGGQSDAGGKLKETGLAHWATPNAGATNESSFTGLPGGYRFGDGNYYLMSIEGFFWTSTEYDVDKGIYYYLDFNNTNLIGFWDSKKYGFSVRCIKD